MKKYIIANADQSEGLCGVFNTKEAAQKCLERAREIYHEPFADYKIQEIDTEVDDL